MSDINYLDLDLEIEALDQKWNELKCKGKSRFANTQKLSLFYEKEVNEWLKRMRKEKADWKVKREALSDKCLDLVRDIQHIRCSEKEQKLQLEKEKYCNAMLELLPEWQSVLERKQIKKISEFETKVSLINERRHSAKIAFEKEKKLLSILKVKQKQFDEVCKKETNEAINRERQRKNMEANEREKEEKEGNITSHITNAEESVNDKKSDIERIENEVASLEMKQNQPHNLRNILNDNDIAAEKSQHTNESSDEEFDF